MSVIQNQADASFLSIGRGSRGRSISQRLILGVSVHDWAAKGAGEGCVAFS
jgi:hypothetical protein